MNFTKWDMMILVCMTTAIVFMSIAFPAIGLSDTQVNESDLPEYAIDESVIDVMGDRPQYPRSPSSGELIYNTDRTHEFETVLYRDGHDAVFLHTFVQNDDPTEHNPEVLLAAFNESNGDPVLADDDEYIANQSDFENQTAVLLEVENDLGNWAIRIEFIQATDWGTNNLEYHVRWNIVDSPEQESSWYETVPILGGAINTGSELLSIGSWGIMSFLWVTGWFVELAINAIIVITSAVLFAIEWITFILMNYGSLISDANGLAGLILAVPGMLLLVELLKIAFILISLLPTT